MTFASLAFNALTVVGLFVLRRTRPDLPRPYRTWGYPRDAGRCTSPARVFFLLYIFVGDPSDACAGIGLVALGFPAYLLLRRRATAATFTPPAP